MTSTDFTIESAEPSFARLSDVVVATEARPRLNPPAMVVATGMVPVFTLVLWLGCTLVSVLGLTLSYARPLVAKAEPAPMAVEVLNVELTSEPLPEIAPMLANSVATPPPSIAVAQPQLPPAMAVALPVPAIAFAVPVDGATRVVTAAQASYSTSMAIQNEAPLDGALPVQTLTYGQGAGKQPAPEYPWRAQSEGQEGVVNVRFTVAETGRVLTAEAVNPCPWPMLNDSAVRTIRNRWRFAPGAPRAFEVAIRFVLPKERS